MKILRGTVFGGIAYFFLGWLIYGILLMDFFSAGIKQCYNRPDGEMVWWALILSNLAAALLLTLILNWSKAKGFADGLRTGALTGALFAIIIDFSFWSMTTMYNGILPLLADILVTAVMFSLVSMVIVLTWGKEKAGNKSE